MSGVVLVINERSGTYRSDSALGGQIFHALQSRYETIDFRLAKGSGLFNLVQDLASSGKVEKLFIAGGDGSVSMVANAFAYSNTAIGIIPLGTMNLAARSLKIPLDPVKAASTLSDGTPHHIDLGIVNDRYFVHHVSIGLHPRLIRLRNGLDTSTRLKKIWATVRSLPAIISSPFSRTYMFETDDRHEKIRTPAIVISNNEFGNGHLPYPDVPDQGQLALYIAEAGGWRIISQAAAAILAGQASNSSTISHWKATSVSIQRAGRRARSTVKLSIDGELVSLQSRLTLKACHRSLKVLLPRVPE